MIQNKRHLVLASMFLYLTSTLLAAGAVNVVIDSPMSPPDWALLERELLRANADACQEFFEKHFDERGYLLCVERWGGDDGADDAIENCNDWPILHALGAPDIVYEMYKKAWKGHLRQYTEARTTEVPFAKDGMYYKEFPVTFDWLHIGEGLTVFNLQGLSDPTDLNFRKRVRRYTGFYMNEDPQSPNYDPKHKIIRSMFNACRAIATANNTLPQSHSCDTWTGTIRRIQNIHCEPTSPAFGRVSKRCVPTRQHPTLDCRTIR